MIADASVLLCAFFPDEAQAQAQALLRDHAAGHERLKAPTLVVYEVTNAVWQAERRERISSAQADKILQAAAGLEIELLPLDWGESLPLARQFNRSAYDAAYLSLAERLNERMITADERLYNAVHAKLKWVEWIGNYSVEQ
jgi:predicted nucleic acid-binding protein